MGERHREPPTMKGLLNRDLQILALALLVACSFAGVCRDAAGAAAARTAWAPQDTGTGRLLRDVAFIDTPHGWAVRQSRTMLVTIAVRSGTGIVVRTLDLRVQLANVVLRASLRATLPNGTSHWSVEATDSTGKPQSSTGSDRLVVN